MKVYYFKLWLKIGIWLCIVLQQSYCFYEISLWNYVCVVPPCTPIKTTDIYKYIYIYIYITWEEIGRQYFWKFQWQIICFLLRLLPLLNLGFHSFPKPLRCSQPQHKQLRLYSTQVLIPRGKARTAVHLKNVCLSRPRLPMNNNNHHHIRRALGFINSLMSLYSINLLLTSTLSKMCQTKNSMRSITKTLMECDSFGWLQQPRTFWNMKSQSWNHMLRQTCLMRPSGDRVSSLH